jgi:hypothetical protein
MEGITGMYRGLGMKLISHSVGTVVYNHAKKVKLKLIVIWLSFVCIIIYCI